MPAEALRSAHRLLEEAMHALSEAARQESTSDDELLSVLTLCEGVKRRLERLAVDVVSKCDRRGVFTARGYRSAAGALVDLLGWERFEARRRTIAAEQVCARIGIDGSVLPKRLPASAAEFAAGSIGLRHVEAIAAVLGSAAAARLAPEVWAGAETQLAARATEYSPSELRTWGSALIETLDQDGAEPDDRPPAEVNELHLTRNRNGSGGRIAGRFDDAAMFDAISTVVDAKSAPATGDRRAYGGASASRGAR